MIPISDFNLLDPGGGGANEKIKGDSLLDNQSASPTEGVLPLKNCHTSVVNYILKRKGYTKYAGQLSVAGSPDVAMEEITGMFQWKKLNGNEYEIVCGSSGGTVGIFDISTPGSPTEIQGAASITDDTLFSFAVVNDTLLMTTKDRDAPLKWNGSGNVATLGGSPPEGKYVAQYENYAFIGNTSTNPNYVYWSALANPQSWTATDFIRLPQAFTGFGKQGNDIYLFTENTITLGTFTGDSVAPFDFQQLNTGQIGAVNQHAIINLDGTMYWMGGDGHIYVLQGLTPTRISEAIPQTINRLNSAVFSKVVAVEHRELRQLWWHCALDEATQNDFVVVYDYIKKEWFFYDGINANYVANFTNSSGAVKTYFGDRNGYIYLSNNGNSDYPNNTETAISFFRYTKPFHFGSPSRFKRLRDLTATVNAQGSAITTFEIIGDFGASGGEVVSVNHDTGGATIGTFEIGTTALGGIDEKQPEPTDVCATSKYIQLKIENNQLGVPVEIRDITMKLQVLPRGK